LGRTPTDELSDGDLMRVLRLPSDRAEKSDALEELWCRHEPGLLSCARSELRDRVVHGLDARDVVQEVFAEVLLSAKAERFDPDKCLGAWLRTIVRNKARDLLRREHRHVSLAEEDPFLPPSLLGKPAQQRLEVEELLAALGDDDRWLCEQFYLFGYSAEAIAQRRGLDKEQVYRDLHRIRTRLRQLFSLS